jgi:hypothetical protein
MGVPEFFFIGILIFMLLEFIRQPLLGELAMSRKKERKKERGKKGKKMPFIVATYVYASSQGQRTHSARTNTYEYFVKQSDS